MPGRATGRLAREGGVRLRWLGHGREGKGQNRDGTVADVHFERNRLDGAGREREKEGQCGHVRAEAGEGGERGGLAL
jgi:hypothetical protein